MLRRMRQKAARTKAKNRLRNQVKDALRRDEEQAAQDWYEEKQRLEALSILRQRQDDLLPEDEQLPF